MPYPFTLQEAELRIPASHTVLQRKQHAYAFYAQPIVHCLIYWATQKNIYGVPWVPGAISYLDGLAFWTHDKDAVERACMGSTAFIVEHPEHLFFLEKIFAEKAKGFLSFVTKELSAPSDGVAPQGLYDLFARFHRLYEEAYVYGEPIVWPIKDSLYAMLRERYPSVPHAEFTTLLTSPDLTFLQQERISLLSVALSSDPEKSLAKHAREYAWIPFDYGVSTLGVEYFHRELAEARRADVSTLQEELMGLEEFSRRTGRAQAGICARYHVTDGDWKLFAVLQAAARLLDRKKEVFTKAHVAMAPFQRRVARLSGLDDAHAQFIHPDELSRLLVDGKPFSATEREKISARYSGSIYWCAPDDQVIYYSDGPLVREQLSVFLSAHDAPEETETLSGTVAYPGIVQGKVRVITSPHEADQLAEGEILVVEMTSPDYLVAMKRAAAIVTNEGGITSHAAIVARELKVPCIVGTKHATRVFATGDLVEVDAEIGEVRKIRHA